MSTTEDWSQGLENNIDELINCVVSLEPEDVIYLEEYLVGDGSLHSPSPWASLTLSPHHPLHHQEDQATRTRQEEEHHAQAPRGVCEERTSAEPRSVRVTRAVAAPKFVSYEILPSATGKKPFQCELCGLRLSNKESRKRHILARHIRERNHQCPTCGRAFIFKFTLKAHLAVHSATPKYVCVCGKSYALRDSYMDHIRRIHQAASDKKFLCELCFKAFGDRYTLRLHLISVHKAKTIPCTHPGCQKLFSTVSLMHCHLRYHSNVRFPCDRCGKSFSSQAYMTKHRLTHQGVRPYVCVSCGRTYLTASHLSSHQRTAHSTARPFQCSICGKCYKTRDLLTDHESSHRGEKPYQCSVCGYCTAYRNTYYAHRKKHKLATTGDKATSGMADTANTSGKTSSSTTDGLPSVKALKIISKSEGKTTEERLKITATGVARTSVKMSKTVTYIEGKTKQKTAKTTGISVKKNWDRTLKAAGASCTKKGKQNTINNIKKCSQLQNVLQISVGNSIVKPLKVEEPWTQTDDKMSMPDITVGELKSVIKGALPIISGHGERDEVLDQGYLNPTVKVPATNTATTILRIPSQSHKELQLPGKSVGGSSSHPSSSTTSATSCSQGQAIITSSMLPCQPESCEPLLAGEVENNTLIFLEQSESCIILSSAGKCAAAGCETSDDSLFLLKVSDDSYVGFCRGHAAQHTAHGLDSASKEDQTNIISSALVSLPSQANTSSNSSSKDLEISLPVSAMDHTNPHMSKRGEAADLYANTENMNTENQISLLSLPTDSILQCNTTTDRPDQAFSGQVELARVVGEEDKDGGSVVGELPLPPPILELDASSLVGHSVEDSFRSLFFI